MDVSCARHVAPNFEEEGTIDNLVYPAPNCKAGTSTLRKGGATDILGGFAEPWPPSISRQRELINFLFSKWLMSVVGECNP